MISAFLVGARHAVPVLVFRPLFLAVSHLTDAVVIIRVNYPMPRQSVIKEKGA